MNDTIKNLPTWVIDQTKDAVNILKNNPNVVAYGDKDGWFIAWKEMKNKKGEWKRRLVPVIHVRSSGLWNGGGGEMDHMVQTCDLLSYDLKYVVYEKLTLPEALTLCAAMRKALYTDEGRKVLNALPKDRQALYLAGLILAKWITCDPSSVTDVYQHVLEWEKTRR